MAEFQEVMKQWQRMCESYKECKNCPFDDILILCDDMPWIVSDIPELEATIMKWAAEHPEPVYPTWGEWLESAHIVTPDPDAVCNQHLLKAWYYDSYIPADIAEKLGIEPKEVER